MIKKEQVAIVVPTYKKILSATERISLLQLNKVLGGYAIYFVVPEKLQAKYLDDALCERFSDSYFENITGYNKLMLSVDFYRRFERYKYILIYQLDAFVFHDSLVDFCNLGYDYIGAPWLTGMRKRVKDGYVYANVGNGGFSLRNVQNTIHLLDISKEKLEYYSDNEDKFFAFSNSLIFKIAPVSIALRFAFERQVRQSYELNNCELPFGCHAWERYDYDFWKTYIEKEGYDLPVRKPEFGIEDRMNCEIYNKGSKVEKFWTVCNKINLGNVNNKKIAIFGSGMYGKRVLKILENVGIIVDCFFDNNEKIQNNYINGFCINAPEKLENDENYFVIISISGGDMNNVIEQLDKMGKIYKRDYITYMDLII